MPFITQILLPKRDNIGRRFSRKKYSAFHARMVRKFGGWTRKGQAEGAWLSRENFTRMSTGFMRWAIRAATCAFGRQKRTA